MKSVTVYTQAIQLTFVELADVCKLALARNGADGNDVVSSACTAVATLIQGAGSYGGHPQKALMDAATSAGFTPEFYAGGIRVGYYPKPEPEPKPAKVAKVKQQAQQPQAQALMHHPV